MENTEPVATIKANQDGASDVVLKEMEEAVDKLKPLSNYQNK